MHVVPNSTTDDLEIPHMFCCCNMILLRRKGRLRAKWGSGYHSLAGWQRFSFGKMIQRQSSLPGWRFLASNFLGGWRRLDDDLLSFVSCQQYHSVLWHSRSTGSKSVGLSSSNMLPLSNYQEEASGPPQSVGLLSANKPLLMWLWIGTCTPTTMVVAPPLIYMSSRMPKPSVNSCVLVHTGVYSQWLLVISLE